ncbi:acyltransferase domain-containing protein [Amycolatopsis sp. cg5]|uniref:acyltransferase domain-containing protein n=1 Tax=Amycolatopsis sp. cg5 TaxID=3238802 RepID=UPI00352393E8
MTTSRSVALLFPGQGAQHTRMAAGLYQREAVFTETMDDLFALLGAEGARLRADWLAERPLVPIDESARAQPLLFAVGYALGRQVLSWGVRPVALLGHSIGEMAAVTLAGVFTPADALRLVVDRVARVADAPPGGMLAVAATVEDLDPVLEVHPDVVVGAVNAPRQTVLAGLAEPLLMVAQALRDKGFTCRTVPATSPFHSPALGFTVPGSARAFAGVPVRAPEIPVYSAYTAGRLGEREIGDPGFWASHPVAPVLFRPALDALLADGDHLLAEAGPGQGLAKLARNHPAVRSGRSAVVALLPPRPGPPEADVAALRLAEERLRG